MGPKLRSSYSLVPVAVDDQHGYGSEMRRLANGRQDLDAADPRQHEIQHDEVRFLAEGAERFRAVVGGQDAEPREREHVFEHPARVVVVLDDEDLLEQPDHAGTHAKEE
jgi:hypothetical protein